ncbi:cytochrome b561 [Dyella jiangningensis]|nr:cytochrome b561 [Dyella sp. AtDHG13]SDK52021.1 cytochrome b561 [Dyella jiangningensis]
MEWQNKSPSATGDDGARASAMERGAQGDELPERPRALVVMHWLTALFLAMAAALILLRDEVDGRALRMWLLEGHRHFGLLVLLLFFARAALRLRLRHWPVEGKVSPLIRFAAGSTHLALYVLLLVQPLLGWALSNAQGKPVHFFGLTLPAIVASDEDLADRLTDWHQGVAWVLLALIALHVAAALWHHFMLRDRTLRLMLPRRRR